MAYFTREERIFRIRPHGPSICSNSRPSKINRLSPHYGQEENCAKCHATTNSVMPLDVQTANYMAIPQALCREEITNMCIMCKNSRNSLSPLWNPYLYTRTIMSLSPNNVQSLPTTSIKHPIQIAQRKQKLSNQCRKYYTLALYKSNVEESKYWTIF
jgi:hypothetical protein